MDAKKYNNTKIVVGITKGIIEFILIFLFIYLGYSKMLLAEIKIYFADVYYQLVAFILVFGVANSLIFFPFNFYSSFMLEHKYNLSNQTFIKWILENLKGTLVGGAIGLPLLLVFYWVLLEYGSNWWVIFATILFVFSVVLAQILPVIILPIFYKVTPISNESLKERIITLAKNVNMKVENVFTFNMSKNTKKANAAFTGLGRTKRIILGDTLLENFSEDEIETVLAHEFGHYKHNHIWKNIIISTISSYAVLYLISVLYENTLQWFGFLSIIQIDALPILFIWGMIIGLFQSPITNYISRRFEYQADKYSVTITSKGEIFKNTLLKLNDQNLGDKEPHPFVEWFFYSHPSINKRINYINSLEK